MTAIRPNLLKLLAPLATFVCGLALFLTLNRTPDAPSATGAPVDVPAGASTDQRIAILQRSARDGMAGAEAYASLGEAYLQKAREIGDPGYYSRAERSFDAALRRDPRNVSGVLGAGTLAGLRHEFGDQLRLGLQAQRLEAGLAALPVIADAQIELGRYEAAARTIQRMLDVKPNLTSYSRASYYRELSGDTTGAIEAMRLAASAGGAPENVAYVQTLLGDLELQRGRLGAARAAYVGALRSFPGSPGAMVGLARIDAAGGDLGRAAARLRRASDRLPLTTTLALLGAVEQAAGRRESARSALATARAQRQLYRAAATAPDAEAVLFEADYGSPARAVELGREVWRQAPSVRSADALGWALTRAGRPDAAMRWSRQALSLGSVDPVFRFHAGMTARATGGSGERDLRLALRGRALLTPQQATQAKEALR